jgi:hypothetical protein
MNIIKTLFPGGAITTLLMAFSAYVPPDTDVESLDRPDWRTDEGENNENA